ncbi:MAG: hypothetical protein EAZ35_02350 [Sphingobacteriia bacterium]|nr:MAG: hypothetical protein EAZ35_02350 [Sphingobacteriia bacterium]
MEQLNEDIRNKLSKIYELVVNGSCDGEKSAAKNALDKLIKKYNINIENFSELEYHTYTFKYKTKLDLRLLTRIMIFFKKDVFERSVKINYIAGIGSVKAVESKITYSDWINIDCAYEYFKRHMNAQWNINCKPILDNCYTSKSKIKRRKELEGIFFNRYIIKSNLVHDSDLSLQKVTKKQIQDLHKLKNIEGGAYNRQLNRGLLLN